MTLPLPEEAHPHAKAVSEKMVTETIDVRSRTRPSLYVQSLIVRIGVETYQQHSTRTNGRRPQFARRSQNLLHDVAFIAFSQHKALELFPFGDKDLLAALNNLPGGVMLVANLVG
jgi:hypothetical protein